MDPIENKSEAALDLERRERLTAAEREAEDRALASVRGSHLPAPVATASAPDLGALGRLLLLR